MTKLGQTDVGYRRIGEVLNPGNGFLRDYDHSLNPSGAAVSAAPVRRVTRHRIPGLTGKNSEYVLGSTDLPQGESQRGQ